MRKITTGPGLVVIIFTPDNWRTWKTQASLGLNSKNSQQRNTKCLYWTCSIIR